MVPLVLADFVDGDDVGVLQVGRGLGLGVKTLQIGVGGEFPGQIQDKRRPVAIQFPAIRFPRPAKASPLVTDLLGGFQSTDSDGKRLKTPGQDDASWRSAG